MKRVLVIIVGAMLVSTVALAQSVVNTKHDLSSTTTSGGAKTDTKQVCVFCHTPHQATTKIDPLWNHTVSTTATYGVYGSDTLNGSPSEVGNASLTDANAVVSNLCLSCHDGTVSVASLYNTPHDLGASQPAVTLGGNVDADGKITGAPLTGTVLTDDHPINFDYDTAQGLDSGLKASSSGMVGVAPLFGGTVQCASCHDPHDSSNQPFLVKSADGSLLCLECHSK